MTLDLGVIAAELAHQKLRLARRSHHRVNLLLRLENDAARAVLESWMIRHKSDREIRVVVLESLVESNVLRRRERTGPVRLLVRHR